VMRFSGGIAVETVEGETTASADIADFFGIGKSFEHTRL
jgi:hypothetical protein